MAGINNKVSQSLAHKLLKGLYENVEIRSEKCGIYFDTENNKIITICKNIFCNRCLTIWLDEYFTCPMCRKN